MATTDKSNNKVYVNLGKIPGKKLPNGQNDNNDRIVAMSKKLADLVGATYTVTAPPRKVTITKGKLTGRVYDREVSLDITRVRCQLGYVTGIKTNATTKRKEPVIKWVPLDIPYGSNLKEMLRLVRTKFKKKPVYVKKASGNRTRFVT